MNTTKQQYLDSIRGHTAYPVYRTVIKLITLFYTAIAAFFTLGAVIGGFSVFRYSSLLGLGIIVGGVMVAALSYYAGQLMKEMSLMLVDMGDSVIDANADRVKSPERLVMGSGVGAALPSLGARH